MIFRQRDEVQEGFLTEAYLGSQGTLNHKADAGCPARELPPFQGSVTFLKCIQEHFKNLMKDSQYLGLGTVCSKYHILSIRKVRSRAAHRAVLTEASRGLVVTRYPVSNHFTLEATATRGIAQHDFSKAQCPCSFPKRYLLFIFLKGVSEREGRVLAGAALPR